MTLRSIHATKRGGHLKENPVSVGVGRRRVIGAGVAGIALSKWGVGAAMGLPRGGSVVRRIAESQTVVRFVHGLGDGEGSDPPQWFTDWCEASVRHERPPIDISIERERAEFFARFAVGVVAPHYLRTAGYNDFAAACECDTDLRATRRSAARAQQSIGIIQRIRHARHGYRHIDDPQREIMAYSAAAHTSSARFYALMDDEEFFPDAGYYAGCALSAGLSYDDPLEADPAETAWLWNLALLAINRSAGSGPT